MARRPGRNPNPPGNPPRNPNPPGNPNPPAGNPPADAAKRGLVEDWQRKKAEQAGVAPARPTLSEYAEQMQAREAAKEAAPAKDDNDAGLDGIERAPRQGQRLGAPVTSLCSNCKYWDQSESDPAQTMIPTQPNTRHMCRRYPVELFKEPADWCGEFST
jgi:hypothetical protein